MFQLPTRPPTAPKTHPSTHPFHLILSQAYKHRPPPPHPPRPRPSAPNTPKPFNSRIEKHSNSLIFTILVFHANFMVSVSLMVRGKHQSRSINPFTWSRVKEGKHSQIVPDVEQKKKKKQVNRKKKRKKKSQVAAANSPPPPKTHRRPFQHKLRVLFAFAAACLLVCQKAPPSSTEWLGSAHRSPPPSASLCACPTFVRETINTHDAREVSLRNDNNVLRKTGLPSHKTPRNYTTYFPFSVQTMSAPWLRD